MSATVAPPRAATSTSRSRPVSGDGAAGQRGRGQLRIDHPLAGGHAPDGVGELLGRGVLDHEAERPGLHRPAQVARAARTSSAPAPGTRAPPRPGGRGGRARRGRASRCRAGRRRAACSRAAATTSSPRPTSATTVKSSSRTSSAASAERTSAWSSASSSRIVTRRRPSRQRGVLGPTPRTRRAAASRRSSPAHGPASTARPPRRPARASPLRPLPAVGGPPSAVVGDLDPVRPDGDRARSPGRGGRRW